MTVVSRSPDCGWNNAPRIIRPSRNIAATHAASSAPRPGRFSRKWPAPGISQPSTTGVAHLPVAGFSIVLSATLSVYRMIRRQMQISTDIWMPWALRALRVGVILIGAWLLTRIVHKLLSRFQDYTIRMMGRRGGGSTIEMEKRATTLIAVLSKLCSLVIWMVATVMALTELTFHIEPLLAGLGVAGLALGLGAQTLIKDWLGGLFLLLEDQLRIGDSVSINGISGGVEEINLRTVLLRGENGAVHVIANGSITTLSNLTRDYSYYVFETTLAYGADT